MSGSSINELKKRYSAALDFIYDVNAIVNGAIRPGEVTANVFDFDDGLRMIINLEKLDNGDIILHVSASIKTKSPVYNTLKKVRHAGREHVFAEFCKIITQRFKDLSGDNEPLQFVGITDLHIPHFARLWS